MGVPAVPARPAPARPTRGGRARQAACLAGLAMLLALALGGCQISKDAAKKDPFLQELIAAQQGTGQQPTPPAEAAQASAMDERGTLAMGKTFQINNTEWTIQRAVGTYALKLGDTTLHARGVFVVVQFTFRNLSDSAQSAEPDMLVLQSAGGKSTQTFAPDKAATAQYAAWMQQRNFLADTLRANTLYPLGLVFDVPRDTGRLAIKFHSYPVQDQSAPMI
jgi:Domain of unknown function (DUF4352)